MLDDCRNTASPRAESCDWLVLSDWSHWLDRISRPFQALDVARRVQVTWLAISSTPLAVNSVVLDFQSSKIKSHVYKVLLNSIYDASKDLWPSICTWSTTWQRKKKQTEALGVNSATALFKRGARTDPEILERGVLACYIDTIIYSLVTYFIRWWQNSETICTSVSTKLSLRRQIQPKIRVTELQLRKRRRPLPRWSH